VLELLQLLDLELLLDQHQHLELRLIKPLHHKLHL
jgi:hypothetical protein